MRAQICGVLASLALAGCQMQTTPVNQYFEAAENACRAGQYELAHQNYSAFLKQNPDPQFARLAERRILAIEREIECVRGQKSGPRPSYVNQEETRGSMPVQHPNVVNKNKHVRLPSYE
ncbi:MAG: hypothetical protein IJU23_02235 [Proteobacteria bacterium]|nr:hypothetical protein [Pseudomonadota bacterium]